MFHADMMSNHVSILKDRLVQELMQVPDMKLFRNIIFHIWEELLPLSNAQSQLRRRKGLSTTSIIME